jgi:DNA gyrase subunit A
MLEHFIDFRFEVTKKRFEYELAQLRKRIHILKGFVTIFDALDETIRIIRKSDGKKDAAAKLMARFKLDEVQVDAILELKLYKLAKLEINLIREELKEKTAEAKRIESILRSKATLWGVGKSELKEVADTYGTPRITRTATTAVELDFSEEDFIVDEDAHVVLTRDGWLKRMKEVKDPAATRLREGDEVMAVLPGSTKENVVFFTNFGSAYVTKINDVTPTTGYGEPVQKVFKFKDGERIIAAFTLDPRAMVPTELLAISGRGFGLRFGIEPHLQVSTRAGRRYSRPAKGDEIIGVLPVSEKDSVVVATRRGHHLICKAKEINRLEGAGKGVTVIKTGPDDVVIGFIASSSKKDALNLATTSGTRKFSLPADPKKATARGGKGKQLVKRSQLKVVSPPVEIVPLSTSEGSEGVH